MVHHRFQTKNGIIRVNVWDTAGQERYRSINRSFYREAKGALLVVDMSSSPNEEELEGWIREFRENADSNAKMMVIGSKCDLSYIPETLETLKDFAKKRSMPFEETSAVTGKNVDSVMEQLVHLIDEQYFTDGYKKNSEFLRQSSIQSMLTMSKAYTQDNKKPCCKN